MIKPVDPKDPHGYIEQIDDEGRQSDIEALDTLIREEAPQLARHISYGMLGYGSYRYRYASGREGEAPVIALASQKRYISLYHSLYAGGADAADRYSERLPAADIGKSCVRFKRLADVDEGALRDLVRESAQSYADDPDFAIAE